jgi:hypothetical protein
MVFFRQVLLDRMVDIDRSCLGYLHERMVLDKESTCRMRCGSDV